MSELIVSRENKLPATIEDLSKFVLVGREKLVAVRAEIRAIEKVGLAQEVRTQKLAEAQDIAEAVLDAEVRIGELMREVPKAQGTRTDIELCNNADKKFKAEVIKESGFTPMQVSRFETLAAHPEVVEQVKAEARESEEVVTRSAVLGRIKNEQRKEMIQRQVEEIEKGNIEKPDGLFDVIAIDPPWNYGTSFDADGRRVANPYPEMTQEQLKALEIPAKDNCVMFLWTTQKFIWDAKELLDTWGFTYRSMIVWDKEKIGMGDLIRMQCEFCLVGIKGSPVFKDNHSVRDIIREPRREHSRKPEEFYRIVDSLCAGRKLDFFSREERTGWFSYGNDTKKF
jgi:N6-adenosine-specific RNA methylase IME4